MENIISITMINPKRKPLFVRCLEIFFYFRLKASMRTHRHKTRRATTPIPMSLRYGLFFPAFRLVFFRRDIFTLHAHFDSTGKRKRFCHIDIHINIMLVAS